VSGAKGEWNVTLRLTLEQGPAPRTVLRVVPLLFGAQTEPSGQVLGFEAPEGASSARVEYRATGHGAVAAPGCRGPAEEFCSRIHSLSLDGAVVDEFTAWRDDCGQLCSAAHFESPERSFDYCSENPCGAPESVRAPRANWCPASVTAPHVLEHAALVAPGPHELQIEIGELAEGGNWLVSATYFAFQ
jgi:hypothetical protein